MARASPSSSTPAARANAPSALIPASPTEYHYAITDAHLRRLLDGALLAISPRIDWARLMRRSLDLDALECGRCGSRLRVIAAITDHTTARKLLHHVGLETEPPPIPRARDPSDLVETATNDEEASSDTHIGARAPEDAVEPTLEDIEPDPWRDREDFA